MMKAEDGLVTLTIANEEKGGWDVTDATSKEQESYVFCLVGRFLMEAVVKFEPMRNTLTNLWHPLGGVNIKELRMISISFDSFTRLISRESLTGDRGHSTNTCL